MNTSDTQWHSATDRTQLANKLADKIAEQLHVAIAERGSAIIAFSGGSTPKPLFQALAQKDIDWANVVVTLVDERWVPIGHPLSNAAFLMDTLLTKLAPAPQFVPLFNISAAAMSAEQSLVSVLGDYTRATHSSYAQPAHFDVAILGMGGDAHTASFFPDASNIKELVDANTGDFLLTCHSPSSQVARVTWSLPMLLNSGFLALHFTGADKREVYQQALCDDDASAMPIRSIIFQNTSPLHVYYAD